MKIGHWCPSMTWKNNLNIEKEILCITVKQISFKTFFGLIIVMRLYFSLKNAQTNIFWHDYSK